MLSIQLTETEARVLGALVEKAVTTPEYYPLTLNALVNACNQKSNRDPVVAYDDDTVLEALEGLRQHGVIHVLREGRAPKYEHYFEEALSVSPEETAVLTELMLRGPQTAGELRGRIERFNVSQSIEGVDALLAGLQERGLVTKLPRQPGRKESRYAHLLAGEPLAGMDDAEEQPITPRADRLATLEAEVAALRDEVAALQEAFAAFRQQFE